MQLLEFNVTPSLNDGKPQQPAPKYQYTIIRETIKYANDGLYPRKGNDWAVFEVAPNQTTGQLPFEAQGGAFQISNTLEPAKVRVTGYGIDNGPRGPKFPMYRTQLHLKGYLLRFRFNFIFENKHFDALQVSSKTIPCIIK